MICLVYGVSGTGKSTLGRDLALALGCRFLDADDFHSPANKAKMERGDPLDAADRSEWLASLRAELEAVAASGGRVVLACSALKKSYRARLLDGLPNTRLIALEGSRELLAKRLGEREGHFFPSTLLDSQLEAYEGPESGLVLNCGRPLDDLLDDALSYLG